MLCSCRCKNNPFVIKDPTFPVVDLSKNVTRQWVASLSKTNVPSLLNTAPIVPTTNSRTCGNLLLSPRVVASGKKHTPFPASVCLPKPDPTENWTELTSMLYLDFLIIFINHIFLNSI